MKSSDDVTQASISENAKSLTVYTFVNQDFLKKHLLNEMKGHEAFTLTILNYCDQDIATYQGALKEIKKYIKNIDEYNQGRKFLYYIKQYLSKANKNTESDTLDDFLLMDEPLGEIECDVELVDIMGDSE